MSTAMVLSLKSEELAPEFEGIFREHYQLAYRTAYSVTGSRQDAEDVLQTVFLRLIRRGYPPEFARNPRAYLYRAAVNQSLNAVRARKRQSATHELYRLEVPVQPVESPLDDGIRRRLLDAIAQLNPASVEMLILRYEHDYSDAEIAQLLGKSRGTVAVTLFRARMRLKKLMSAASGENQ